MTRVNVGIREQELCDQHLLAEYRELPRCFNTRTDANLTGFRLGKGHQLWCAQFQRSLHTRQWHLCCEMTYRGFTVNRWTYPIETGLWWGSEDEEVARPLLRARILERLATMKRTPTWTKRETPAWVGELDVCVQS